ncbi:hypothetical protein, partial [Enterobacter hormaechei]
HSNRSSAVTDAAQRAGFNPASGSANDGGRADVSLAAGTNLFDNRVNISTFVDYRQSSLVRLRDRANAVCEVVTTSNTSP